MRVVLYSTDHLVISLIQGLMEQKGDVVVPDKDTLEVGHLVIVDYAFPHSLRVINNIRQVNRDIVVAVIAFNPFAINAVIPYNVDAFITKPLSSESVQALIIGAEVRSGSIS